ncbi:MAG: helix-turn-helix domain-containing protein [Candidatus Pacearchaeota archaeon]
MEEKYALKKIGLNDKEAEIYIELLKLGNSKVNEISKRLNLPRTTIYSILNSLLKKGLVFYTIKSGTRYFEAVDPKRVLKIEEEKLNTIKSIIPKLEQIKKTVEEKPEIEIYEGVEGIKTILENILKIKPEEILVIECDEIFKTLEFYFPHWSEKRIKEKIFCRIIQEKTDKINKELKLRNKTYTKTKFLPKEIKINTMTYIYNENVAFLTMNKEKLIGVIIKNKDIAQTQKKIFELIWKLL